jgi:hypothetical protein
MNRPGFDDEHGRREMWRRDLQQIPTREDVIAHAVTALALREAEIHRLQQALKEYR